MHNFSLGERLCLAWVREHARMSPSDRSAFVGKLRILASYGRTGPSRVAACLALEAISLAAR